MKRAVLTLAVIAVALAGAAPALARRAVNGATKATILRALDSADAPRALPACNHVWISTVRPHGADWALVVTFRQHGPCSAEQEGDSVYLHRTRSRWRPITDDDEVSCRNGGFHAVPLRIQFDLLGCRS